MTWFEEAMKKALKEAADDIEVVPTSDNPDEEIQKAAEKATDFMREKIKEENEEMIEQIKKSRPIDTRGLRNKLQHGTLGIPYWADEEDIRNAMNEHGFMEWGS